MRTLRFLALSALLLLLATTSASAATTLGQTFVPISIGSPSNLNFQSATSADQPSYAVPAGGGVITSWSHIPENPPDGTMKFIVMRAVGADYMTVAVTDAKTLTGAILNTFATRISVLGGDMIGIRISSSAVAAVKSGVPVGNVIKYNTDDPAAGQFIAGGPLPTLTSYVVEISATLEPDADGDGFGDESQDQCATDASTQGPCKSPPADKTSPAATLSGSSKQDVAKQGSVDLVVTSNEAGSASASGTLNVPGASKAFTLKGASATLAANVKTTLKLKLTKKTKSALAKALKKGRKPTASVTVLVKDVAGNATSSKRTIKVKGKRGHR